jgi:hypothetical protein
VPSAKMASRPAGHGLWPFSPPVRRAGHDQHAKVPLVPEAMERAWIVLFPVV